MSEGPVDDLGPGGAAVGRLDGRIAPNVPRAAAMLLATLAAVVGLLMVVGTYLAVLTTTLRTTGTQAHPCLVAYAAKESGARVHYDAAPPRAVCTWSPGGAPASAVVARGSTAVFGTGVALAVGGIGVAAFLLATNRRGARRA